MDSVVTIVPPEGGSEGGGECSDGNIMGCGVKESGDKRECESAGKSGG